MDAEGWAIALEPIMLIRDRWPIRVDKSVRAVPLVIFTIAIVVRLILLSQISHDQLLYGTLTAGVLKSGDEGIQVAVSLLQKGRFSDPFFAPTGPTAHVPPSFPATTALIFYIFGMGFAGAVVRNLFNICGYALTFAVLPAASAALGIRRRVGAFAGLIAALYPILRSTEVFRGRDEWLAALLLLGLTVTIFRLIEKPSLGLAAVYGLGWGGLMYVFPSTLTILPVHLVIFLICAHRYSWILRAKCCGVAVVLIVALVVPWAMRNRLTLGGWIPMRDNFGLELLVSNGPDASASQQGNQERICRVHPTCSAAAALRVSELGELRFNREALHQAIEWITNNPRSFWRLTLHRMVFFWGDLPSNRGTFLVRAILSFAAFIGLALMWRNGLKLQAALFGAILFAYPLLYYIVQYSNRYVATILFAILIPAAFTFARLADFLPEPAGPPVEIISDNAT